MQKTADTGQNEASYFYLCSVVLIKISKNSGPIKLFHVDDMPKFSAVNNN